MEADYRTLCLGMDNLYHLFSDAVGNVRGFAVLERHGDLLHNSAIIPLGAKGGVFEPAIAGNDG